MISGLISEILSFIMQALFNILAEFSKILSNSTLSKIAVDSEGGNAFYNMFGVVDSGENVITLFMNAFVVIGVALIVMLAILGIFRNIFSGLGFAGESPFKMVFRIIIALFCVKALPEMMMYIYTTLYGAFEALLKSIPFAATSFSANGSSFQNVGTSIATFLISLIFLTMITFNMFKFFIEIIERYLLCNCLIFFSPLVASTITLESTLKIFSSYCKMFAGQMILLMLNIVSVNLILASFGPLNAAIAGASDLLDQNAFPTLVISFGMIMGFIKIAQKFDNYLRDIGMIVGVTGGDLVGEMITTGKMLKGTAAGIAGGLALGKSGISAITGKLGTDVSKIANRTVGNGVSLGAAAANTMKHAAGGTVSNLKVGQTSDGNTVAQFSVGDKTHTGSFKPLSNSEASKFKPQAGQSVMVGENGEQYLFTDHNVMNDNVNSPASQISLNNAESDFEKARCTEGVVNCAGDSHDYIGNPNNNFASFAAGALVADGVRLGSEQEIAGVDSIMGAQALSSAGVRVSSENIESATMLRNIDVPISNESVTAANTLMSADFVDSSAVSSGDIYTTMAMNNSGIEFTPSNYAAARVEYAENVAFGGTVVPSATINPSSVSEQKTRMANSFFNSNNIVGTNRNYDAFSQTYDAPTPTTIQSYSNNLSQLGVPQMPQPTGSLSEAPPPPLPQPFNGKQGVKFFGGNSKK